MILTINFYGICAHFGSYANPDLPVAYRVVAPQSDSSNDWVFEGKTYSLGRLNPAVTIQPGVPTQGPVLLTIPARPSGPGLNTAPLGLAHLTDVIPNGTPMSPSLAYGRVPPGKSCFVDLHLPGTMTLEEPYKGTVATRFTYESAGPLRAIVATATSSMEVVWTYDTTILVSNSPSDINLPAGLLPQQILLGLLAVNPNVPAGAYFQTVEVPPAGGDPNQPGCSNSQWP